jgi:hypothetical protein
MTADIITQAAKRYRAQRGSGRGFPEAKCGHRSRRDAQHRQCGKQFRIFPVTNSAFGSKK